MNPVALHRWQYADYREFHGAQANLWIHLVAVPLFLTGNLAIVAGAVFLLWWLPLAGLGVSFVAFALQGIGHKKEANAPKPFTGPWNMAGRILVEQWVTFPRFVFSGGWGRALRDARSRRT